MEKPPMNQDFIILLLVDLSIKLLFDRYRGDI